MRYNKENPGDWGQMRGAPGVTIVTEKLTTADACEHFLRSWKMDSPNVLLLVHGLGAHSGWFIDMGTQVASHGISVYAMDHRGFGRSGGIRSHIDDYHTYVEDIGFVLTEIRKRHPEASIFVLGHSMGGIFTAYTVAKYQDRLAGALFLNPWVRDTSHIPLGTSLGILLGGLFKSKRYWQIAGGTEIMTTNPEAIQMLQEDYFWQRRQTSSFLFQIGQMRSAIMKQARQITIPARVMQGENDKSVIHEATHELYEALASSDKTWKTYPGYDHDSEMQDDRSQLDNDLVAWIREHSSSTSRV